MYHDLRHRISATAALALTTALATTLASPAPAAHAAEVCTTVPIWVNTPSDLFRYTPSTATIEHVAPLNAVYGDIAWTDDGSALYGVVFDGGMLPPELHRIDPATGDVLEDIPITGAVLAQTSGYGLNALTAIGPDRMLTGSYASEDIYELDLTTGDTTVFATMPTDFRSAGDFTVLPGGDILALAVDEAAAPVVTTLVIIRTDGGVETAGRIPMSYGAAQSGGVFYAIGHGGNIYGVDLGRVGSGSTANPPVELAYLSLLDQYGATAVQDAVECAPASTIPDTHPKTGVEPWGLVALGTGIVAAGAVVLALRHRRARTPKS